MSGELGAAIETKAPDRFTALMAAAGNGHLDVVKYLVDERGAAIEAKEESKCHEHRRSATGDFLPGREPG